METRSRALQTFCPNPAVVSLYYRPSDRESHTHPLVLCREERLENVEQRVFGDPNARIGDRKMDRGSRTGVSAGPGGLFSPSPRAKQKRSPGTPDADRRRLCLCGATARCRDQ